MRISTLSLITAAVLLAAEAIVIPLVMRPLFLAHLGPLMLDSLRLVPAVLFYAIHIFGLVFVAGLPALRAGNPKIALINGAVLGFVAYSCYEMTSWTIMRDWHINLVLVDVAWGTFISSVATYCGARVAIGNTYGKVER
jgi:uncharacterized membrane protein